MRVDVIIIGGGPVGSVTARGLAQAGLQVAVVDHVAPKEKVAAPDGRSFSINPGSQQLMARLGLWGGLEAHSTPIKTIEISEDNEPGTLTFRAEDVGVDALGFMIHAAVLRAHLETEARRGVFWAAPDLVQDMTRTPWGVTVRLASGTTLEAPLVIAADGRFSETRREAGMKTYSWDYAQKAVVGMIAHTYPHQNTAWEHFMPSGPLAILPMAGDTSGFVWTTSPQEADRLQALAESDFCAALEAHIELILGRVQLLAPRLTYPLSVTLSRHFYAERLALVGDAAHAIHPVAGQALNLGFRDAAALIELIVKDYSLGLDIGRLTLLKTYEQRRRADTVVMTSVTDGLVRLFRRPSWVRRRVTQLGLSAFRRFPILGRVAARYAMGGW